MIRINLVENRVAVNPAAVEVGDDVEVQSFDTQHLQRLLSFGSRINKAILVVIIFVPITVFYGFEQWNLERLSTKLQGVQADVQNVQGQLDSRKEDYDELKKLEANIAFVEGHLQVLKGLSDVRLREIKFIDSIQNIMPKDVWLSSWQYSDGNFDMNGQGMSYDVVDEFVSRMRQDKFYKTVLLKSSQEQQGGGSSGNLSSFVLKGALAGGSAYGGG